MILFHPFAGPVATGAALLFLAFGMSQCSGRVKAEGKIADAEQKAEKAEKKREVAQGNYDQCKTNRITLDEARKRQNAAVDAVRQESEARVAASVKAVSEARKTAESYRKEAARILAAKPKGDTCEAADALVLEVVG